MLHGIKQTLAKEFFGVALWRLLALTLTAVTLLVISVQVRAVLDLEWSLSSLRSLILSLGIWGPIAYTAILTFRFLVLIPTSILLIASGVVFGPVYGALWAGIGLTLSGFTKYAVVTIVGRDVVLRQLPERAQTLVERAARMRQSAFILGSICAYPIGPKHVFQLGAVLSGMVFTSYGVSVMVGSFIRGVLFANLGEALYSGQGIGWATAALIVLLIIPFLTASNRNWVRTLFAPAITKQAKTKETNL